MENLTSQKLLPDNIVIPNKSDQFMALGAGDNKFRAIGQFKEGFRVYDGDKKPHLKEVSAEDTCKIEGTSPFTPEELESYNRKVSPYTGRLEEPVYFWAILVYNQIKERFQVLVITQISVINQMKDKLQDPDFQDSTGYDFEVNKKGENKTTKYVVTTGKHKPLPEKALKTFEAEGCNLYLPKIGETISLI